MDSKNTGTPNPIAPNGVSDTSKTPPEIEVETTEPMVESSITSVQPQPSTPTQSPTSSVTPQSSSDKPKNSKSLIAISIICVILALAGTAFGIYSFMDANNKSAKISELQTKLNLAQQDTEAEVAESQTNEASDQDVKLDKVTAIDKELAQNIIDPYLKELGYNNILLRNEFNEDTKAIVSYANTSPLRLEDSFIVPYWSLNGEYQSLFGDDASLDRRNYNVNTVSLVYDDATNRFTASKLAGGGTGGSLFSIVKQADLDDGTLVVEVYSDTIPWCDPNFGNNDGYCYEGERKGVVTLSDGNMEAIISNQGSRIPVYKMLLKKDTSRYILSSIQKP